MDLKQLATLLENPQPEYWAQITQAQLDELRENVQRSWTKHENLYLWCSSILWLGVIYLFLDTRLAVLGLIGWFSIVFCLVLVLLILWLEKEALWGVKRFCDRKLNPLEKDSDSCTYALKLSETPEVNDYRLKVLERGRNLIAVDVAIMANISKEVQEEQLKTEHKSSYQKLHEKTDITGAA